MASNVLHQVMSSTHTLEGVFSCSKQQQQQQQQLLVEEEQNPQQEKRVVMRPQPEQALHCPRCDSTNTKFCYYNNYSLSQPRYFCKGCRRYWTQGGTLRNVPIGSGCRKNKRPSSTTSLINSCKRFQDQPINHPTFPTPTDLAMAFRHDQTFVGNSNYLPNPSQSTSFLDILRGGFLDSGACCFQQNANHALGGVQVAEASLEGSVEVKHEPCASGDEVGAQYWLQGGDGNVLVDPVRDYWGGLAAPWHGLVNSSLM